ncbi:MAG: hypothetical protein AAF631_14785, partial [Pseudomonadota bacterium]
QGGDSSAMMGTPMEIAKKSFDATVKHTTDMAEIVRQGNMDAFNILKDRVTESVEELRGKKPE